MRPSGSRSAPAGRAAPGGRPTDTLRKPPAFSADAHLQPRPRAAPRAACTQEAGAGTLHGCTLGFEGFGGACVAPMAMLGSRGMALAMAAEPGCPWGARALAKVLPVSLAKAPSTWLLSGTGTGGHLLSPPAGSPFGHRHSQGQSPRTQSCHRRKRRPERPVTAESPAGVRPGRGGSAPRRAPPQRSRTRFPRPLLPGPLAGQRLARREDSQSRRHPRDGEAGQWPVPRPQQQPLRTPGARCRDRRPPLLPDSILRVPEPQEGQGPVFSPGDQHPRTWTVGPVCWNAHLLEGTGVPLLRKP